ncbi:MAG: transcriptional regulator, AraC family protein [Paenibacillus sp.]|nr:transcriptional regulator, AraC family protein [Paenibacillus sp.]
MPSDRVLQTHRHIGIWQADWLAEGSLTYYMEGFEMELKPGEIGFIPSGVFHRIISRKGNVMRSLKFEAPAGLLEEACSVVKLAHHLPLLGLLAEEVFRPRLSLPWRMHTGYLGSLLRLLAPDGQDEEQPIDGAADEMVQRAVLFALEHLREPLTVERLARHIHLSESQFARRFYEAVGATPMRWLTEKRMQRAAQYLRFSDMAIFDIADEAGYGDMPAFSKAFKRWSGISPSDYRNRSSELEMR